MAYEHSAPRNKVIYGVGALFVLMVLLLIPIGRSYFFALLCGQIGHPGQNFAPLQQILWQALWYQSG